MFQVLHYLAKLRGEEEAKRAFEDAHITLSSLVLPPHKQVPLLRHHFSHCHCLSSRPSLLRPLRSI